MNEKITKLKCRICGFESTTLIRHITGTHKTKTSDYKKKYNVENLVITSKETKEKLSRKRPNQISVYSLNYWLNKGYTEEDAKKEISIRRPTNINYWLNKGYTEEDAKKQLYFQSTKSLKKETLIELHGEDEGNKKYEERIKKCKLTSKRSIDYWLNKGYTKEESKQKQKEYQSTFTLDKCIEKWGEERGSKIYNDRQTKWLNKLNEKSNEEKQRINKLKDSGSIEYFIKNYGNGWKEEYFKHNLYDTNASFLIKKIVTECKTKEDIVYTIKNNLKEYDYNTIQSILRSVIVKYFFRLDNLDIKKIIRVLMGMYGLPTNRNGIFGKLILYKDYLFKSIVEYNLCLFFEKNNIDFEYELKYPFQIIKNNRCGYKCDFYITKLDLYIEYAGLMKNVSYVKKMNDKKEFCLKNNLKILISSDKKAIENYILERIK